MTKLAVFRNCHFKLFLYMIEFSNNNENINATRNSIVKLLRESRLYDAIVQLGDMVTQTNDSTLSAEFERIYNSYKYLLEYFARGFNDPDRQTQIDGIVNDTYLLTDKATLKLFAETSSKLFYVRHNSKISNLEDAIERYRNINDTIAYTNSQTAADNYAQLIPLYQERESIERDIFHYVWTQFPFSEDDKNNIGGLLSADTPVHFKCLIIGAMLLALLYYYDEAKLHLLIDIYTNYASTNDNDSIILSTRALTCLAIALYRHSKRCEVSKIVSQRIALLSEKANFKSDIENVFINLVRAKNAETLSKSIQDSIIPDIMKIAPDIIERAKKNKGVIDITSLEENPEWHDIFNKSGLSKKIEEFSKMQTSGDDVFLSTFAHLKHYSFFKDLYNWFRPYHTDNSAIAKAISTMKPSVGTLISGATYLCDNDKYSFVLSLNELNDSQRDMMLQQFDARGNELSETQGEYDPSKLREEAINMFIKDIYRFFTLFSRRSEFANIFNSKLALQNCKPFAEHLKSATLMQTIAEIYFKTKEYASAIEYYNLLAESSEATNPIYLQKMGFAYQSLGNFDMARKHYMRYSLTKENDVWNLKHIAACHRAMGNHADAAVYYAKALELKPSDITLSLTLGHCYVETGNYEKALKEYYKVEYLDTAKHSAWRPLAWCHFLMRDFDKSRKYYTLIFTDDTPKESDYLNLGHLCLAEKKFNDAIQHYYGIYASLNCNLQAFADKWRADVPHLIQAGISEPDIPLLLDAIMLRLKE